MAKANRTSAIGRRKTSVARVYVTPGEGKITVNNKDLKEYFERDVLKMIIARPFDLIGSELKYNVNVNVVGGGKSGQAGAVRLAIARALIKIDPTLRPTLKKDGLLTRDAREVERKKYGRHGARRRPQYSKR